VQHVEPTGQDLGFRYPGGESPTRYRPVAEPGDRAPHAWITSGGLRRSVLDLFDRNFSLIIGADGRDWEVAAAAVTARTRCPIRCYRVGTDDLEPVDGELEKNYQLGGDSVVLVRPDGHVAWRGDGASDLVAEVGDATGPHMWVDPSHRRRPSAPLTWTKATPRALLSANRGRASSDCVGGAITPRHRGCR
jgi:hypothetical protein